MSQVPIPFHLSKNDRDRRGLPIPFIVYRDAAGVPHFTIDDNDTVALVLAKKLCGLCGKPLKTGQLWLIGGPAQSFGADGLFISPPSHEDCARYSVKVCPFLAAPKYSRFIEDKTLSPDAVREGDQLHRDALPPPRPPFIVLARASGIKLVDADDGSGRKFIQPRRPWKQVEFWRNGEQIAQDRAATLAEATEFPPGQLQWWPA